MGRARKIYLFLTYRMGQNGPTYIHTYIHIHTIVHELILEGVFQNVGDYVEDECNISSLIGWTEESV